MPFHPDLKDETIHIRIAGIDAPEVGTPFRDSSRVPLIIPPKAAHFGRPAQLHSRESLDWLRETLLRPTRKTMWCQVLRKDQYGRIVSHCLPDPLPLPR